MAYRSLLTTTALALMAASLTSVASAQDRPQTPPAQAADTAEDEEATDVEALVVTATPRDVVTSADRVSYNVANDLQRQSGSVADVLRNVPGVEVDLQGNVSLRGDSNVTILIDGRPSGMLRGEGRGDALQAMSAGQVERVEVITNPSADFSPEGSGGIINLISKPTRAATSTATVRGSWNGDDQGNLSVSGSRAQGGLTLAGDLGVRRQASDILVETSRVRDGASPATTVIENSDFNGTNVFDMANARLSADYDLNPTDRISGEINWREFSGESNGVGLFQRADGNGVISDRYQRLSDNAFGSNGVSARTSWRRKFSGQQHELVADFEYDSTESNRDQDAIQTTSVGTIPNYVEQIRTTNGRDAYGFKVDYTRPMGERQTLKLGYEGDLTQDSFDFFGARGPDASALLPVPALTNRFEYDQTIHAAYVTYDRPFGELDVQAGLRVEQVDFTLNQITDAVVVERHYLRAYPTIHMGYQLTDTQRLRGSYSRRIARPSPQDLNPYTIYQDPQNLRRGNPDLEPEITDSFELSWQMRAGQSYYSLTGFYRDSEGGVTDVAQDLGNGVVLTTRENLGQSERIGVEFIANGKVGSQITYNASGSVYRNEIATPGIGERSGTTGMARASINWQPTPNDFFQLNGFYIGEQVQAQGAREPFGLLNLGYRRKITEDFSLVLTGTNILDTAEQRIAIDTPTFRDETYVRFSEPTYFIGFTYLFGGSQGRRPEPAFDFGQPQGPG